MPKAINERVKWPKREARLAKMLNAGVDREHIAESFQTTPQAIASKVFAMRHAVVEDASWAGNVPGDTAIRGVAETLRSILPDDTAFYILSWPKGFRGGFHHIGCAEREQAIFMLRAAADALEERNGKAVQ